MNEPIPLDKPPYFLIAMPQLLDPNFHRSVVLVFNRSQEGILGLVINRPTPLLLKGLTIPDVSVDKSLTEVPIWFGGPVEPNRIWLLHKTKSPSTPESMPIADGVQLGAPFRFLDERAGGDLLQPEEFKLLIGYAAWQPGQLAEELQAASWLASPVDPKLLLETPPEKIWEKAVRNFGIEPTQLATDTSSSLQ